MGPPPVSMVLVVVLCLTTTLSGLTIVHAERNSAPDEDTRTINMTSGGQDNQCSQVQKRQDLMDNRVDKLEANLNRQLNVLNNLLNALDKVLEAVISVPSPVTQPTGTSQIPKDCQEAYTMGSTSSGVYRIAPESNTHIDVFCEQQLDGGGWTVFQARKDGSEDFYRDWNTYKQGFGNLTGEFWLGNTNIHLISKHHDQQLKIELTSPDGEVKYANYARFWITDEADKYRLTVGVYSGGTRPGDSIAYSNGAQFSTRDQDHDTLTSGSCATRFTSAWWFKNCFVCNLNGQYGKGVDWHYWKPFVSMKATRMLVRKRP